MVDQSLATAQASHMAELPKPGADQALTGNTALAQAAESLSQEANQIGMNGYAGGAQRLAIMAGDGLAKTPEGVAATIKQEGVLGLATTAAESVAVGVGLRVLMTKAAPLAGIAALALGSSFVAQTVPQFYDACRKAINANTWGEMDQASSTFGQATGELALNSVIGVAGFKLGSGGIGMTRFAKTEAFTPTATTLNSEAPAITAKAPLRALALGEGMAALEVAPAAAASHLVDASAAHEVVLPDAAVKAGDTAAEIAKPTDAAPIAKSVVSPEHTISMKELVERDPAKFAQVLDSYYGKLETAFPDASEIETKQTYIDYLKDKDFPWDMLVLNDKAGNVLGGIQSQVVDVGGAEVNKAVWAEHIWLAPEARTFTNFQTLLKTAKSNWAATGSDIVFMEFNDRAKMTWEEQVTDASAGLTPEARERIWGRVGLYVLGDESNHLAPYAQPAMGDGAPVNYLSMGIGPLKGDTLDGQSMPIGDYLKLMRAAHSTIPDVNLETDPTVVKYTADLAKLTESGQDRLSYARLRDTQVSRTILERLVGGAK